MVLAGGTLQPFSHLTSQLLGPHAPPSDGLTPPLVTFSCGHVIPGQNLLSLVLGRTASRTPLLFDYLHRSQPALVHPYALRVLY